MRLNTSPEKAINSYLNHGDNRPDANFLSTSTSVIQASSYRAGQKLICADMLIDLAVVQANNDSLTEAEHLLDSVIARMDLQSVEVEDLLGAQKKHLHGSSGRLAVMACLRKAELANWRHSIQGDNIEHQYDSYLEAAAEGDMYSSTKQAQEGLMEFIPVILGARGIALGRKLGWFGRLSLEREDSKIYLKSGSNPNWDCGLSNDNKAAKYISPHVKLQVKRKLSNGVKLYEAAGIAYVAAKSCGFNDPSLIINSCLHESNLRINTSIGSDYLLASDQLDTVTEKIDKIVRDRKSVKNN